jgi:hypothetical protein
MANLIYFADPPTPGAGTDRTYANELLGSAGGRRGPATAKAHFVPTHIEDLVAKTC